MKIRPAVGRHAEGEAGREDDQARHDGHEGVQAHDPQGLAGEGAVLALVAAEDGHVADAHGKGEEGLGHGRIEHGVPAHALHLAHVRGQIKAHARARAGQGQAADHQQHQDGQQAHHDDLDHALHALLHAHGADQAARAHHDGHAQHLLQGAGQRAAEKGRHARGVQPGQVAGKAVPAIGQHPARDRGVEHGEQVAAPQGDPAEHVPARAFGRQDLQGASHVAAGRAPHGEFHDHHRQHGQQAEQVDAHEDRAAVRTGDVGEAPDVPQPDGAARRKQQEARPVYLQNLSTYPMTNTKMIRQGST